VFLTSWFITKSFKEALIITIAHATAHYFAGREQSNVIPIQRINSS